MNRAPITYAPIALMLVAGLAPTCPAQDQPGSAERVEEARSILPRVGTNQTPVQPTTAAVSQAIQPGLGEGPDWLDVLNETLETKLTPSMLAEGAFISSRLGDLIEAPSGQIIFVPDRAEREPGEGAVILLPSRALERLQEEWSEQRVVLSGEILTYHNRNMLLVSDYRLVRERPAEAQQPESDASAAQEPQREIEDDPEVQDLLRELDRPDPTDPTNDADPLRDRLEALPRTPQQRSGSTVVGPEEGTLLLRRPARLVRDAQGAWSLTFDNDDPTNTENASLVVLPCRALMRMEQWAMDQGDAARFLVSGRVYSYRGQSYLLPTIAQRLGASDINSMQ
ncbi:MAG: hypothetical protein JJ916_11665 [Phycisphaerales bacterium]|nr:hypothetical protein [Phycisphaerales bacterium]